MNCQTATPSRHIRSREAGATALLMILIAGLTCSPVVRADPSALTRPKLREMIRTQGWNSIENWQQIRDQADNLMAWSLYEEAAKAYGEADKILQRQKGAHHPRTLRNRVDRANANMRLGKPEGEKELLQVYEMQKKRLQEDHPDILLSRHLMANLLIARGEFEAAEKELLHIVSRRAIILGPGNEATLASRTNLAYVFTRLIRFPEAEEQLRLVLAAEIQTLGPKDVQTCSTRERLGECLQSQSKFDEALAEYRAVHTILHKEYGPRHPLTFRAQYNLAYILYRQGKHEQAEKDFTALAATLTSMVGPEDPQILECRGSMAACMSARGKLAEAEKELRAILDLCARMGAQETLEMQEWRNDLADVLVQTRRVDEAERLLNITLDQRRKLLGGAHPLTLDSWQALANCKVMRGNFMAAESDLHSVLAARMEMEGPYHISTINTQLNLADTMRLNGRPEDALPIFSEMHDLFRKHLGPLHPFTLHIKYSVAITLYQMGRVDASMDLQKQLLKDRERILGPEHPDTLRVRLRMAYYLMDAGRFQESEGQYVQAIAGAEKTLSATHELTIRALSGYAEMLAVARRPAEAEKVARQGIRSTAAFSETSMEMLRFKELLGLVLVQQGRAEEAKVVASEIEHLLLRQEGRLSWQVLTVGGMVAWVKLANGDQDGAGAMLAKTLAQLRDLGMQPNYVHMLKLRALQAFVHHRQGKKAQVDAALEDLIPGLKEQFRDGEPIRLIGQVIVSNKANALPSMLHAVEFSRTLPQEDAVQERQSDFFPPNTPPTQQKEIYDLFAKAAELSGKKQHEAAYEQFAVYLKKASELAGEHSLLALSAHLRLTREAVILSRMDQARQHAEQVAKTIKRYPLDGNTMSLEFLYRTYAEQLEQGHLQTSRILTEVVLGQMEKVLGLSDRSTLSCSIVLGDILVGMDAMGAGGYLKALLTRFETDLGRDAPSTVDLRVKLMRWHLSKSEFQEAHVLAHRLDLPVKLHYGEYSENSLSVREAQAAALEGLGLRSTAVAETRLVLADHERISGAEALATVYTRHRLAQMLQRANQPAEALQLHETNIRILKYPATEKLPIMIDSRLNAALALLTLGRAKEAEAYAKEGLKGALNLLDEKHPIVNSARKIVDAAAEAAAAAPKAPGS